VFVVVVATAIVLFSVRYSDSVLHEWTKPTAVAGGFVGSRGCHPRPPCFAVASQFDDGVEIKSGVNEYALYFTDRVLILLFAALASSLVFVFISAASQPKRSVLE
jgi:hypothetical protein